MRKAVLLVTVTLLLACGGSDPVARLTVTEREVSLPHGRLVPLELRWEPLRPLEGGGGPVVFVHLLDGEGNVVRTFDHALPGTWKPGSAFTDRVELVQSALAPALPAGEFRLSVGLYDGGSRRWPLATEVEEVARHEYQVAKVRVPENDPAGPRFAFSEQWVPVEATGDRQTVARRWLSGDGTVEVSGLPAPAEVVLALSIPKNEPPLRMVLDAGVTVPTVTVVSECSGFAATVSGAGQHHLRVPVPPPGGCRLRFDTTYLVLEPGSPRKLSVSIEQLAWQALPAGSVIAPPAAATVASPATAGSPSPAP
jgi:hypothetical protein